jgi:chromosome partitioning protein
MGALRKNPRLLVDERLSTGFSTAERDGGTVRTLAVLSQKGGTGKTTVAVHLAVAAWAEGQRRVLMADLDPQRSSAEWRRARQGAGPVLIESKPGALFVAQQAADRAGVDLMVLDTRPAGDTETAEAIRAADLCLVVLRPSFFDLKATQRMVEMTEAMNKPALFMLNQAPPRRGGREPPQVLETIEALRQRGLPLAPIGLRSRAAYQSSVARGLTAGEAFPGTPAARELALLWSHMEQALWPTKAAPHRPMKDRFRYVPIDATAAARAAGAETMGAAAE